MRGADGDAKQHVTLRQVKLRGLQRVEMRFTLAAAVVDLRRMCRWMAWSSVSGRTLRCTPTATSISAAITTVARISIGTRSCGSRRFAMEVTLAALHWICRGRGYELTALDVQTCVQMAYRLASGAGHSVGQSERVALRIQTMLRLMTREVRCVRDIESSGLTARRRPVSNGFRHQSRSIGSKRGKLSVVVTVKSPNAYENFSSYAELHDCGTIEWE